MSNNVQESGSRSMEKHRAGRNAIGAVIFARAETPDWILPLFTLAPE